MFEHRVWGPSLAVVALFLSGTAPAMAQDQQADQTAGVAKPEFGVPTVLPPIAVTKPITVPKKRSTAGQTGGSDAGQAQGQAGEPEGEGIAVAAEGDPSEGATAGRDARTVERTSNVTVVSAKQIEQAGAKTLDQALRLAPGVYIRDGGGEGVPRIDIRGMRTRNVLLLVDGIPYNSSYDGQFDPRAIPTNNIARIKVTEGSSSVLYGPFGNAAVIEIITKGAEPGLHGSAETEFTNGAVRGRATGSYGGEKVKTFVSTSGLDQDHWRLSEDFKTISPNSAKLQPGRNRINSDRTDGNAYGNMEWDPSAATKVGISVTYTTGDRGKPPQTVLSGDSQFAKTLKYERLDDSEGWKLQASVQQKLSEDLTLRPIFFYNQLSELTDGYKYCVKNGAKCQGNNITNAPATWPPAIWPPTTDILVPNQQTVIPKGQAYSQDAVTEIYGGGQQLMWRWGKDQLLTLSANAQNESWKAVGFDNTIIPNNPYNFTTNYQLDGVDHSIQTYWAAAEQELRFTSKWTGVAGIGYAENHRDEMDSSGYSYLVGTRYELTDDTAIRGSVSRKIRFPTLKDLYDQGGDKNLRPEITQNYEVALDHRLRKDLFVTVALFNTKATDFIEKDDSTATNIPKYEFQGVETRARYTGIRNLDANFGYTFLDATNESPGASTKVLQARPRHRFTTAFDYSFSSGTKLHLDYLFSGGSSDLSNKAPKVPTDLPDYHLVNVGVSQEIVPNAEVFARATNLLDQNYVDNYGFEQAGRTLWLGARARW